MPKLNRKEFNAQAEADVAAQRERERELAAAAEWNEICERQAWDALRRNAHLENFIREEKLFHRLVVYGRSAAKEQNERLARMLKRAKEGNAHDFREPIPER